MFLLAPLPRKATTRVRTTRGLFALGLDTRTPHFFPKILRIRILENYSYYEGKVWGRGELVYPRLVRYKQDMLVKA